MAGGLVVPVLEFLSLTGPVTPFRYMISYTLNRGGSGLKTFFDTVNFSVGLQRDIAVDETRFDAWYWDRDLSLRSRNASLDYLDENVDSLELRFAWAPGDAAYNYTNATVQLQTASGTTTDNETFSLNRIGTTDTFTVKFRRAFGNTAVRNNGILETAQIPDTVMAIFRNNESPKLPLDTMVLRCPVRYGPGNITLTVSSDTIMAGDTATISGAVFTSRGEPIPAFNSGIRWVQLPPQLATDTLGPAQGATTRFTTNTAFDSVGNPRNIFIVATVVNPYLFRDTVRDTARIVVVPRKTGLHIYAERVSDTSLFKNDIPGGRSDFFTRPEPLDVVTLDSLTDALYTYAVVRDDAGNFVRFSSASTVWQSLNTAAIGVVAQSAKDLSGVGYLTRIGAAMDDSGLVQVSEGSCLPSTFKFISGSGRSRALRSTIPRPVKELIPCD